jgi:hypothetical protein
MRAMVTPIAIRQPTVTPGESRNSRASAWPAVAGEQLAAEAAPSVPSAGVPESVDPAAAIVGTPARAAPASGEKV